MFAALLITVLLPGCSKRAQTNGPAANIFRDALTTEPTTFDPAEVQDVPTADVLQNIYEGLVRWSPQNTVVPGVAASWTVSKDGKTYTFKIRPGIKFHSGKLVTADDVVYSLSRGFNPKLSSPVAMTYLGDIVGAADVASGKTITLAGVKALDTATVAITIGKPKAYWIDVLTYPTAYILNKDAVNKDPNGAVTDQNEDGTGPFTLTSYVHGEAVDLKAYPNYWAGPPKIAGIHWPIILDANTRHELYTTGQLDIVDLSAGMVSNDENDPVLSKQVVFFPRATTEYLYLNLKTYAPFADKRVRQAFAYATDKAKIVTVVYQNHCKVANDILPAGIFGYDPNFQSLPFDPAKAKRLLSEAGYPGGVGLPALPIFYAESHPNVEKTVDELRQMYSENLGVTIELRRTEFATLLQQEDNNVLPALVLGWSADYLDPQDFYSLLLHTGSPQDHTGYSNRRYDALCDAADAEQNQTKRLALYRQAATIAAKDVPVIPLYYQQDPELVKPYVHNLQDSLMRHLPFENLVLGP
jgi:oligopeptide transport system substrate-binding protein